MTEVAAPNGPSSSVSAAGSAAALPLLSHRTITYRHLVSAGTLNPSNPLRVVCLTDVDSAYAQFEARRLGIPREVPLVTVQWQGVLAISYSARKYGISRHDTLESAKKRCPHLTHVHVATYAEGDDEAKYHEDPRPETHKVSLDPYRRESRKIVAIFNEMCPLGAVEKASIDELYCDMTLAVRQLILRRFPHLAKPPPDSPLGLDTPLPAPPEIHWAGLGHRMPTDEEGKRRVAMEKERKKRLQEAEEKRNDNTNKDGSPAEDPAKDDGEPSTEEAPQEISSPPEPSVEQATTWTDYALACGAELISTVRQAVFDKLGYTMTAGIASNKTLAKLIASENKPDSQTVMLPAAVLLYFRDLDFQKIRFLGGKLGDAIASEWEHSTVGDLWSVSLAEMQQKFGDESRWVYDVLRGIDHSAVIERTKNKTMLASKNVKPSIKSPQEAQRWLSILSSELTVRLREAREESPTLWPATIVLRYLKPRETARSRQSNFPFVKDLKAEHVYKVAQRLWDEAVGSASSYEVVTVALGFSGLEAGEHGQKSIEGFFSGTAVNDGRPSGSKSAPTAAGVSKRSASPNHMPPEYATGSTEAAQLAPPHAAKKVKRNGIESMFQSSQASKPAPQTEASPTASLSASLSDQPTWTCPECQKVIHPLPRSASAEDGEDDSDRRLTLAQQDHQDYHFAMTLQREASAALMPRGSLSSQQVPPSSSSSPSQAGSGKKGKRGGRDGGSNAKSGLKNFFKKSSA